VFNLEIPLDISVKALPLFQNCCLPYQRHVVCDDNEQWKQFKECKFRILFTNFWWYSINALLMVCTILYNFIRYFFFGLVFLQ